MSGGTGERMKALITAVLLFAIPLTVSAQSCRISALQSELAKRTDIDQAARKQLQAKPGNKAALDHALAVDADNTAWMRKMVAKCGWPKESLVGKEAAHHAWLLTQHADMAPDYQVYAAEKLKAAVLEHEAEPWDLAVLVDRNRRLQGNLQVYGMQFRNDESGTIVFFPMEAPESLDARRKEIGLESFYCWAHKVSGKNKTPIQWPAGVLFKPEDCPASIRPQ